MMKTVVALFALLVLAVVSVVADDNTYVTNESAAYGMNAIISCQGCDDNSVPTTSFHIASGQTQGEGYSDYDTGASIHIELWLDGAGLHNAVNVDFDRSIVGYTNADGTGVDIYLAKYGTLRDPDGGVLITIFVN